jgi:hypothetical protein
MPTAASAAISGALVRRRNASARAATRPRPGARDPCAEGGCEHSAGRQSRGGAEHPQGCARARAPRASVREAQLEGHDEPCGRQQLEARRHGNPATAAHPEPCRDARQRRSGDEHSGSHKHDRTAGQHARPETRSRRQPLGSAACFGHSHGVSACARRAGGGRSGGRTRRCRGRDGRARAAGRRLAETVRRFDHAARCPRITSRAACASSATGRSTRFRSLPFMPWWLEAFPRMSSPSRRHLRAACL